MDPINRRTFFVLPLYVKLIAWKRVLGIASLALLLCGIYSGFKVKRAYEHHSEQSRLRLEERLERTQQTLKELESLLTLISRRLLTTSSTDKIMLTLSDHYIHNDSPMKDLTTKGTLYWMPQGDQRTIISPFGKLTSTNRPSSHFFSHLLQNVGHMKVILENDALYCGLAVVRNTQTIAGFLFLQIPLHDGGSALTGANNSRIRALHETPASSLMVSSLDTQDYGFFKSPYCMDERCYGSFLKLPFQPLLILFENEALSFLSLLYEACGQAWELIGFFGLSFIIVLLFLAARAEKRIKGYYSQEMATLTEYSQDTHEQLRNLKENHQSLLRQYDTLATSVSSKEDLTQQLASLNRDRLGAVIQRIADVRYSLKQQPDMPALLIQKIMAHVHHIAEDIHLHIVPNAAPHMLSLHALFERTVTRHCSELYQRNITVHLDVPAECDAVFYDRLFLTHLFDTLFMQSLTRTPTNGMLCLSVDNEEELRRITFHDSGFTLTEDAPLFFDALQDKEGKETPPFALSDKALDWMMTSIGASLSKEYIGGKGHFMRLTLPALTQTALSDNDTAIIIPFSSILKAKSDNQLS